MQNFDLRSLEKKLRGVMEHLRNTGYDLMAQDIYEVIGYINQNKEFEESFADIGTARSNKIEGDEKKDTDFDDAKSESNARDFSELSTRLTTLRKHLSNEAEIGNKLETYIKKLDEDTFVEADLKSVLTLVDRVESKNSEFIELVLMETYLTIIRNGAVNDKIKKFVFRKLSEMQTKISLSQKKDINRDMNPCSKPAQNGSKMSSRGMERFISDLIAAM